ncbi:glycoside hydrolase family 43 protein [Echinicola rosea]|uniref:Alpha-N-arabinofuranosidase n=1 Tax=Echinicola rosea TaxID=1807691 RepID=A0ABQ1VC24_9BACT|nr:glycoside hydrolase family 43 protein [Echinicola rosea]GGF50230.1 alpha-N-arabinofuranosidase [Echinicola rosea]
MNLHLNRLGPAVTLWGILCLFLQCNAKKAEETTTSAESIKASDSDTIRYLSEPLITDHFTADPSAHVFEGKIYIYPSHDIPSEAQQDDTGAQYAMKDYHVYSMESPNGTVKDHGEVLHVSDVQWAAQQMWAPDAAQKGDKYYLYFPAKDNEGIFRLGVAVANNPAGPFKPQPAPIKGSFSIDPAVFEDSDGAHYIYWGGIWGGQLQKWRTGKYLSTSDSPFADEPAEDEPAIAPKVAKLSEDMLEFGEEPKDVEIIDKEGEPIKAGDHERRFFEAAWMHKHGETYYFSYSTGDTHTISYATGDNPYGPFTYQGVILKPVQGWTNHHSIVKVDKQWYIFYHDTQISGKNYLRNIKMAPLTHNADGSIQTITPMEEF